MEMETEITKSEHGGLQLATVASADSQKAWHIFALLLSLGRPTPLVELASRCTLFSATPNLVEFLCGIHNSPICLTPNHFVTFSSTGCIAIARFVTNSNITLNYLPRLRRFEFMLRDNKIDEEALKTYFRKRRRMISDDNYLPVAKRRRILDNLGENGHSLVLALPSRTECASEKEKAMVTASFFSDSFYGTSSSGPGNTGYGNGKAIAELAAGSEVEHPYTAQYFNFLDDYNFLYASMSGQKISKANREITDINIEQDSAVSRMDKMDDDRFTRNINYLATSFMERDQQMKAHQTEIEALIHANGSTFEDEHSINSFCSGRYSVSKPIDTAGIDKLPKDKQLGNASKSPNKTVPSIEKEKSKTPLKSPVMLTENSLSLGKNQQAKSTTKLNPEQKNAPSQRLPSIGATLGNGKVGRPPAKEPLSKRDKKSILPKQNLQHNYKQVMDAKEKRDSCNKVGESSCIAANDQPDQRVLPDFEAFVAEEQEGSGGYGTVYKARRKSDGVTFAIKCPHANANKNHVNNEMKMLERFGGKNFVIKYEGSFKSGNSDCLVLEHVEHDRPEVLKRDIDVSEIQWYGYCMFRALASLHKQGIVHRDVKPGNFLFNRKACKGYLIDFNLALDLNQKHGATVDKTKAGRDVSFNLVPLPHGTSLPSAKNRKLATVKALEVAHQEQGKVSNSTFLSKNMKKEAQRPKTHNEVANRNIAKREGADGSGVTSAKDATSTRTPSGEKFREPIPCRGRKELISLVHEALQGTNQKPVSVPVSKRKRIAAPPRQADCKFVYLTPMPLHSAGAAVAGAGLLKNKGDGKQNREGPCVGTKGFRAPEVLVRSQHQGPKVDIWSAGVTLLYMMIGRTPFAGDPDQNIKEIAKLRGSEDLWEVAKLHNRESSFPTDLLDIKSLPSLKLQDWCKQNTRRSGFLDIIPKSLFDLVDKCLTVNPRLRISAEEALRHEYFASCHEAFRRHRLLRQGISSNSGSNVILNEESQQMCEEVS